MKSLSLRHFADGTVTLFSINFIKWMPSFAVRLSGIKRRSRNAVIENVFFAREKLKMLGVHASRLSANVINDKSFGNVSVDKEPSNAMCAAVSSAKVKSSISVLINLGLPHMAVTNLFPLSIKSFVVRHMSLRMERMGAWNTWGNF
jgi:hypothetical protein